MNQDTKEKILEAIADKYGVDVDIKEAPEFIRVAADKQTELSNELFELRKTYWNQQDKLTDHDVMRAQLKAAEERVEELEDLMVGLSVEKQTNPEFFRNPSAKQYFYSVTLMDAEATYNKFDKL